MDQSHGGDEIKGDGNKQNDIEATCHSFNY